MGVAMSGEVIDKIKGEPSQKFEKMFPAKQPSRVVVTTNDGRIFEEYLEYPKGDPREPMTMDDLKNKFNSLVGEKLTDDAKTQLKETIFNSEEMSAGEFMKLLNV